ncbi:uncharacterized protein LOC106641992 [Copidosoma floridanum]|uniref:uncharacterized protein LOC106641992 n=1 Tax=Copidosoma floridanum TaxID=29053 RepID=UPI0006C9E0A7|nr:uncharacterized protein LOC106641992 [Copidosoma floridanum]
MDLGKDFYQKWKAKSTNNRCLFLEDYSDISKIEPDKIFSSTALEEQERPDSHFSLRLSSESYVDETQEECPEKPRPQQVILISESSSNDSALPPDKSSEPTARKTPVAFVPITGWVERNQESSSSSEDKVRPTKPLLQQQPSIAIIEDSDSEDNGKSNAVSKEIVADGATLSERKKKEILDWLACNFDSMRCGAGTGGSSSYSQDSVVSGSRKSGTTSSGNSSLERLEMNYETPNNRHKLVRPTISDKLRECEKKNNKHLSRRDQISRRSRVIQLDIVRDQTPGSKNSDKTPTNVRSNRRRVIKNATPASTGSDSTLKNQVRLVSGKRINQQTSAGKSITRTPIGNARSCVRKIIKDKSPVCMTVGNTPPTVVKIDRRPIVMPERLSSEVEDSEEQLSINNAKSNVIISESESFESKESDDFEKLNSERSKEILPDVLARLNYHNKCSSLNKVQALDGLSLKNKPSSPKNLQKQSKIASKALEITDDADIFKKSINPNNQAQLTADKPLDPEVFEITDDIDNYDESPEQCSKDKESHQEVDQPAPVVETVNTTVNDCADILENLYGEAWRNKAKTLISSAEPKKQMKDARTEKMNNFRKPQFNLESKSNFSDKKNIQSTGNRTKSKNQKSKDSFINNRSTSESSSPDGSYYTALSNPTSQNNLPAIRTTSTVKVSDKNVKSTVLAICDSESSDDNIKDNGDDNDENWKMRSPVQRRLSFDSSSSSITSEFDPDDIVPPKTKAKTIKFKKFTGAEVSKPKSHQQFDKRFVKKSFLASLSKEVPLHQADFKAMTYRNKYTVLKEELCKVLFRVFNEKVFQSKLPDDMVVEWSVRLTGTAGKCYNKQTVKALGKTTKSSRIVLAAKVLDSPERLRDTLIHEMCHAATWLINNVSDGHGRFWKAWAHKAMKVFPELPPITRCHDYQIQTKYTYKCTSCGYSIGRHSKSLDLNVKRCGYCYGKFELLINKVTKNGKVQTKSTAQSRELTGFALYVKENYQSVKKSGAATKHAEVMKLLGQQFSAIKLMPKPGDRCKNNNNDESP